MIWAVQTAQSAKIETNCLVFSYVLVALSCVNVAYFILVD